MTSTTSVGTLRLGITRSYTSSMKNDPVSIRMLLMPLNTPTATNVLRQAASAVASSERTAICSGRLSALDVVFTAGKAPYDANGALNRPVCRPGLRPVSDKPVNGAPAFLQAFPALNGLQPPEIRQSGENPTDAAKA